MKNEKPQDKKIKRRAKKKAKTISKLKKEARYWTQRYVRLTQVGSKGCFCCYGCKTFITDIKKCDAAHYLSAECYQDATFDLDNINVSCKGCNIKDPTIAYRKNLILLKGEKHVDKLEVKYKRHFGIYKWNREYLNDIILEFKEKCKYYEKHSN